jgi:UDP-N-acetylmuramoyl-tripeptide--D-alanyl-D-alanine ligase
MLDFTLRQLTEAAHGRLVQGDPGLGISGLSTDSRFIRPGELFIALKGERFDGHRFLETAVCSGASAVLVMETVSLPKKTGVIQVTDTLKALGAIARAHRDRFVIPVVGITGSNGKTTTKDLIAAVLEESLRVVKTEKNFNNEIGLPLTLLKIDTATEAAVVEMGMRGPGQIRELAGIALPTLAVVTNVGLTHLELLHSKENIARAKAELVEALGGHGVAILNGDDPYVRAMQSQTRAKTVFYGIEAEALDYRALNIETTASGTRFTVMSGREPLDIELPLPGRHNIMNALAAVAVGRELGLKDQAIRNGLRAPQMTGKRLRIFEKNNFRVIDDTYNASPASVRAALDVLNELGKGKRKLAVLGDMLELGPEAAAIHREIGQYAAATGVDRLFACGELAREYVSGFRSVNPAGEHFESKPALIDRLQSELRPGDQILVKGSRGMKMEEVIAAVWEEESV